MNRTVSKQTMDARSTVFRALNGNPRENMQKVIEILGGIDRILGENDIVVIKPNLQWWNQGAPNLAAMKTFIEMIMDRPGGFKGEVVVAENAHRGAEPWLSGGWARRFERNSDLPAVLNMNDLVKQLKNRYGEKFTACHWIDAKNGGNRIFSPSAGSGYIYCDGIDDQPPLIIDNGLNGLQYRSTIMTYPVFKTGRGTMIDLKNGVFNKDCHTGQPLRLIMFSALNHHSSYCGITSTIKNYMGISDLSGGPNPVHNGRLSGEFCNFHSYSFDKWKAGTKPGLLGGAVGMFMKTIRKADLNITTAEWVGLTSRTDPPYARTQLVMASTDPVALDYHGAKYVVYPNSKISFHDPDLESSPVRHYLQTCAEQMGGIFDEQKVEVKSYNLARHSFQTDDELTVLGEITWGSEPRELFKYLIYRAGLG